MNTQPICSFSDKRISRKNNIRGMIRSPKSISQSHDNSNLFIKNVTKPILRIDKKEQEIYHNVVKNSSKQSSFHQDEAINRVRSENDIMFTNKTNQFWTPKRELQNTNYHSFYTPDQNIKVSSFKQEGNQSMRKENQKLRKRIEFLEKELRLKDEKQFKSEKILSEASAFRHYQGRNSPKNQVLLKQIKAKEDSLKNEIASLKQKNQELQTFYQKLEAKYSQVRQQNQKLNIELDILKRKCLSDLETQKKLGAVQISNIKQKYFKLLSQNRDLSKQNCDLKLKMKKFEKDSENSKMLQTSLTFSDTSQILYK